MLPPQDLSASGASVWLLPAAEDAALLSDVIDNLAARFGTPRFEPHLTLAGNLRQSPKSYSDLLDRLAAATTAFSQPIEDIVQTDAFFRSFYASFARGAALDDLKAACVADTGAGELADFVPHVSLLYGAVKRDVKNRAANEFRRLLKKRPISFDRVAVTNSSDNVPIGEWRICDWRSLK